MALSEKYYKQKEVVRKILQPLNFIDVFVIKGFDTVGWLPYSLGTGNFFFNSCVVVNPHVWGVPMKRPLRLLFVWFMLMFSLSASAQDEKAQKLFMEAELYFKASKFEKAGDLYIEAFVASQIPDLLFNLAQCYRNLKKYEDTLKTFKQYMILVSDSDENLANNIDGLKRIQALLPDIETENDFPKKNTTVKKLMKDDKDLVATLLNKAAALPKPSALSITGTPEAVVFLDDIKLEGKTPLDILKAKKCSHQLKVTRDGFFPWNQSL